MFTPVPINQWPQEYVVQLTACCWHIVGNQTRLDDELEQAILHDPEEIFA